MRRLRAKTALGVWSLAIAIGSGCGGTVGGESAAAGKGGHATRNAVDASRSNPQSADAQVGSTGSGGRSARDAAVTNKPPADSGASRPPDAGGPQHPTDAASPPPRDAGRSVDAGSGTPDSGTANLVPAIVAVGYAGLRVVSFDHGRSWVHKQTLSAVAADDEFLFRGVTYGNGLFIAVGHKILTSSDGVTWTERTNPQANWLGGVQWGNGRFVAAGGYGTSSYSTDGQSWEKGGNHATEDSEAVAFGDGVFMTSTRSGNWWRSTDGGSWTLESGGHSENVAYCNGMFRSKSECPAFGDGVYIKAGSWNSGIISYSDDGSHFTDVNIGYMGSISAFAFGYAPAGL